MLSVIQDVLPGFGVKEIGVLGAMVVAGGVAIWRACRGLISYFAPKIDALFKAHMDLLEETKGAVREMRDVIPDLVEQHELQIREYVELKGLIRQHIEVSKSLLEQLKVKSA